VGAGGRINSAHHALVDYNRSGVPLVEIVSEPDIRSAAHARAYAAELRGILVATGASDGRMEEGSMRVDANVSVRPAGTDAFGTRCEIKNLNSLRSLGRGIEYEAARQIALLERGEPVAQETRHWDEAAGRTESMRSKEQANDYRYFPEPDLVPLVPDGAWQARVRTAMGPMPADRRAALVAALGGTASDAEGDQIRAVVDLGLDTLVGAAVDAGAPAALALARAANEVAAQSEAGLALPPRSFAALLAMESGGQLSATQSKAVLGALLERGDADPSALAAEMGFEALEAGRLGDVVAEVIAAHPDEWARYVAGDDKLTGLFTRDVMQATSGQANGKEVAAELRRRRDSA
jgi:aspartyl-tRNA(Asn)/glutamyl-tRNA(Gln) amidotransferase subunit B